MFEITYKPYAVILVLPRASASLTHSETKLVKNNSSDLAANKVEWESSALRFYSTWLDCDLWCGG